VSTLKFYGLIALVVALVMGGAAGSAYATPSEELDQARTAFRAGRYDDARNLLSSLLYPKTRLSDPAELAEAHLLLGVSEFEGGDVAQAERELEEALFIDTSLKLDPLVFSSRAVEFFQQKKEALERRSREDEEKARLARERDRLRRILANLVVVEKRSYWVNFVPFGAGQFQNGQRAKGIAFFASQAALGGASAGLWAYQVIKYGFSGKVPPEEVNEVNWIQRGQVATGLLFLGVVAWGIVDSLVHYEHVVSRQADPSLLKEFELQEFDKETGEKGKARPHSSLRLIPALDEKSVGLGLSIDF
jgi:hypothetical protein